MSSGCPGILAGSCASECFVGISCRHGGMFRDEPETGLSAERSESLNCSSFQTLLCHVVHKGLQMMLDLYASMASQQQCANTDAVAWAGYGEEDEPPAKIQRLDSGQASTPASSYAASQPPHAGYYNPAPIPLPG